jgi:probable HAF family extracellular repeat protein
MSTAPRRPSSPSALTTRNDRRAVRRFHTGTTPGFVYSSGAFTTLNPVVNALVTNAQGINNNGLMTGFYSTDGTHCHGFLFNTGTASYTLIADPNVPNFVFSQLLGINDKGIVVGYYGTTNISQHGFLYDVATGQYTFLDDPNQAVINGVSVTQITGISDSGEITGF